MAGEPEGRGARPTGAAPVGVTARARVETPAPWATVVGYSRAVRAGGIVQVSGTAAVAQDGSIMHPGNPYAQAQRCLEIVVDALERLGAGPQHVVRTRVYLTRMEDWQEVGRAHGEVFGAVRPATSFVQVASLIDPDMLVEIEAEAVL